VFLTVITSISEIRNLSILSELLYFNERNKYDVKNCDLYLSVEWVQTVV